MTCSDLARSADAAPEFAAAGLHRGSRGAPGRWPGAEDHA